MEFSIKSEYIELCQLLKATGLCDSGGTAKIVINEGLVKVDDAIETRKKCKIRPGQHVSYNRQNIIVK
ncbi:MAG: hypothetical protein A2Y40_03085 [Candidatus Margulisbacteria bacterium GWF2_35_9]|nr:MAG: hypothetical protein A2Y40_03085 [Candidatus Margulisbacteria bacterium GWF2_35_9]